MEELTVKLEELSNYVNSLKVSDEPTYKELEEELEEIGLKRK
jgi:hypothetical protein